MATLDANDLLTIRQGCAREIAVNYSKPQINAAAQAIEDVFTSGAVQNALSNAIDTATSPLTMTGAQKKALVKWYLQNRFDRGN